VSYSFTSERCEQRNWLDLGRGTNATRKKRGEAAAAISLFRASRETSNLTGRKRKGPRNSRNSLTGPAKKKNSLVSSTIITAKTPYSHALKKARQLLYDAGSKKSLFGLPVGGKFEDQRPCLFLLCQQPRKKIASGRSLGSCRCKEKAADCGKKKKNGKRRIRPQPGGHEAPKKGYFRTPSPERINPMTVR